MPVAVAEADWKTYCAKLATVAEYAAQQRDDGVPLAAVLAEIEALDTEDRLDRERYADAARLAFGADHDLSPGQFAKLVYRRCMTSIAI